MARRSFTVQRYESDSGPASAGAASVFGSYLQYPLGPEAAFVGLPVKTDEDTQIKSDDLAPSPVLSEPSVPGSLTPSISYFESQILDYNEVKLKWDVALTEVIEATPQPTRVLIVYSDLGEPQTVAEGLLLVNSNSSTEFTHYVQPGKWAYYSMFLKYENTSGSVYYDKVSSIAELLPNNYGCSEDMYAKIPEYYRNLDSQQSDTGDGPLKRMISLFGFEADRARTAIDYLISCKDPLVAHSQVLDVIAKDLTVDIRSDELGTAKLRNILDSVGLIRRSLGTPISIALIVQSATGSEANFNLTGPLPAIDIYAQRVNLLKDPNIVGGAAGSFVGGTPKTQTFTSTFEANGPSVPVVSATYEGGTPFSSLSPYDEFADADESFQEEINEQYWQYAPDPASGGSLSYLKTIDNIIPISPGERLYFSMHGDFVDNAQDQVVRVALYALNGAGAASAGYSGTADDVLVCEASNPVTIAGIKYWELLVPNATLEWYTASLTIFVDTATNISKGFQKLLLEKLLGGTYFDGDTAEGGWVIDYATGNRVSDYRWHNIDDPSSSVEGPAQESYSVYNANYRKTRVLADRYLSQILPVKQTSYASIVYSNAPDSVATPIWSLNWNVIKGLQEAEEAESELPGDILPGEFGGGGPTPP